jgi:periplasmic protein TonB
MKRDAIATGVSVAAHVIAFALLFVATLPKHHTAMEIEIVDHPRPGPPAATPEPPPPAPAPRAPRPRLEHAKRAVEITPAPAPDAPPLPVADEPSNDDDGDDQGSGTGEGSTAGAPGPVAGGNGDGNGSGAVDRSRDPELDRDSCIRNLDYPWRAQLLDKEGVVRLRVTLDDRGRVREAVVLQHAGYGFDEAAAKAVLTLCRFRPAIDRDGHPMAYVIDDLHFTFRFADFYGARNAYQMPHTH